MKAVVSYKFTGLDKDEVLKQLNEIKGVLDWLGIDNYINCINNPDINQKDEIIKNIYEQIQDCDIMIGYINHQDKSEGMLLELGIAKGLGKKVVLFVDKKVEQNFFLTYALGETIIYEGFNDFKEKLIEYFGIKVSRQDIDNIDKQMMELIKQRFSTLGRIAKYKKHFHKEILDMKRRKEILQDKLSQGKKLGFSEKFMEEFWNNIHEESIKKQIQFLEDKQDNG